MDTNVIFFQIKHNLAFVLHSVVYLKNKNKKGEHTVAYMLTPGQFFFFCLLFSTAEQQV